MLLAAVMQRWGLQPRQTSHPARMETTHTSWHHFHITPLWVLAPVFNLWLNLWCSICSRKDKYVYGKLWCSFFPCSPKYSINSCLSSNDHQKTVLHSFRPAYFPSEQLMANAPNKQALCCTGPAAIDRLQRGRRLLAPALSHPASCQEMFLRPSCLMFHRRTRNQNQHLISIY